MQEPLYNNSNKFNGKQVSKQIGSSRHQQQSPPDDVGKVTYIHLLSDLFHVWDIAYVCHYE